MALFQGILQAIIARWLKTTMVAAQVVPSALVVAKVTLKSLYASWGGQRGISIKVPLCPL